MWAVVSQPIRYRPSPVARKPTGRAVAAEDNRTALKRADKQPGSRRATSGGKPGRELPALQTASNKCGAQQCGSPQPEPRNAEACSLSVVQRSHAGQHCGTQDSRMETPASSRVDARRLRHGDSRSPLGLLGVNAQIQLPDWNASLALTASAKPATPALGPLKPSQRRSVVRCAN